MKTIFQIMAACMLIIGAVSCEKSYTCTCTYLENNTNQKVEYELPSSNRKDAANNCDNKAFSLQSKESVSCSLGK